MLDWKPKRPLTCSLIHLVLGRKLLKIGFVFGVPKISVSVYLDDIKLQEKLRAEPCERRWANHGVTGFWLNFKKMLQEKFDLGDLVEVDTWGSCNLQEECQKWSDLDVNQHVNKCESILAGFWKSAPLPILENYELAAMTLEYRKECGRDSVLQSLHLCSSGKQCVNNP
nr:palmitoyl-acyl carrier protein thioesterase, chloroplastic [Ipomoea batatas]